MLGLALHSGRSAQIPGCAFRSNRQIEEDNHMHRDNLLKKTLLTTAVLGMLVPILGVAGAFKGKDCVSETKRPLSDFLAAQGSSSTFFPPVPDYVGWAGPGPAEAYETFALVDYAGLANSYIVGTGAKSLQTQVNGQVWECALADGTARVTVKLVTANALGFAQSIADLAANDFDFAGTDTNFGAKAVDVAGGAEPAKGTAQFMTSFTIEYPGAPLPDFLNVVYTLDYAPGSLDFRSTTIGRRPDGKRAILKVEQVATQSAAGDWIYTVENVEIVDPGR